MSAGWDRRVFDSLLLLYICAPVDRFVSCVVSLEYIGTFRYILGSQGERDEETFRLNTSVSQSLDHPRLSKALDRYMAIPIRRWTRPDLVGAVEAPRIELPSPERSIRRRFARFDAGDSQILHCMYLAGLRARNLASILVRSNEVYTSPFSKAASLFLAATSLALPRPSSHSLRIVSASGASTAASTAR